MQSRQCKLMTLMTNQGIMNPFFRSQVPIFIPKFVSISLNQLASQTVSEPFSPRDEEELPDLAGS